MMRRLAIECGPGVFPEAFTRDGVLKDDWPKGAVAMTKNLDMLTDEPLELAVALRKLAETKAGDEGEAKEWLKFSQTMSELVRDLQVLNEPSRAADAKSE